MNDTNAFDYGQYQKLYDDPRTKKALQEIDTLSKKMGVKYAIIGGLAVYLHVKNPPEDFPDVDVLLYGEIEAAKSYIKALSRRPKFWLQFLDCPQEFKACFATMTYDGDIQIDLLTSLNEKKAKPTKRIEDVEIKPTEPLIVEKLIRGTREDVLMAIDLLAYTDYDKALVHKIAAEYKATGMYQHAAYFARRLAAGVLSRSGLENVLRRLAKG